MSKYHVASMHVEYEYEELAKQFLTSCDVHVMPYEDISNDGSFDIHSPVCGEVWGEYIDDEAYWIAHVLFGRVISDYYYCETCWDEYITYHHSKFDSKTGRHTEEYQDEYGNEGNTDKEIRVPEKLDCINYYYENAVEHGFDELAKLMKEKFPEELADF